MKELIAAARKRYYREQEGFLDAAETISINIGEEEDEILVPAAKNLAKASGVPFETALQIVLEELLVKGFNIWIGNQIRQAEVFIIGSKTSISLSRAIEELLASKRAANRRDVYIKSLKDYLKRFAAGRESMPLGDLKGWELELWLAQFKCPYSRQTWLNRISTLFSFAVRRGYIEANPCDRIERVTCDLKPPVILSPEQAEDILMDVPPSCRAYLTLGLYAGIRPAELMRLTWDDVDLDTKTVKVDGKTRRRRIVPLEPKATALLAGCPSKAGRIAPSHSTVRRFKRSAATVLGFATWPHDLLRHTAASYLLALHGDAGKVSLRLGNSSSILLSHYHEPVTAKDCEEFWKCPPF